MSKYFAQPCGNFICLFFLLQNYTGLRLISIVFGPEFPHQQNTGHDVSTGWEPSERFSLSLLEPLKEMLETGVGDKGGWGSDRY